MRDNDNAVKPERAEVNASPETSGASELVDQTLRAAVAAEATDIHLEPGLVGIAIKFRRDGVLCAAGTLPKALAANVVARCKVLAGLLSYRTDIPQEGGAPGGEYGPGIELRISTFPTLHGERVAIRIFNPGLRRRALAELGLPEPVREGLCRALRASEGLVLLCGPCGSGKTTTLYAALEHIRDLSGGGRSIFTVEDPIENALPGVTQTAVRPAVGLSFASSMRSLLRQDPEVIMVGEARDAETARVVNEAALTGHLVLSTVHAGRAALAPHRMLDMGVEPYALAGALTLTLSQRLARLLCQDCKTIASDGGATAVGCAACRQTGYRGRALLAEKLERSEGLHDAIMARASRREFAALSEREETDIVREAERLRQAGLTDAAEFARVLPGGGV